MTWLYAVQLTAPLILIGWQVAVPAPLSGARRPNRDPMSMKIRRILFATPMCRFRPFTLVGALCLLASVSVNAAGATVYRWVDDQGKIHYSEIVPQPYQGVAKPVDAPANDPTAEQRREALGRAQKEKAKAAAIETDRQRLPASAPTASAASQPAGKRPAETPTDQTDCETWQRLYLESIECFGSYRTVRGATKPEAFDVCNVVAEPPPTRCRLHIP